ncbi:aquaporin-8-like [Elysia marginata]|uniref:Aquaporin-8-like n=1 Tax=Elysia marginata TaxID=1093978 RepID=A0AAV4HNA6_9GAST|nr:aquaporin-8-like [Elysia marginata]
MISYNSLNDSVTLHKTLDSDKSYQPSSVAEWSRLSKDHNKRTMSENEPLLNSRNQVGYEDKSDMRIEPAGGFFEQTVRPCLGEFFGVTLFVFIGTMSVNGAGGLLGVAIAHGLMIALLVAALGSVSGGHINPAVTLGVLCAGGIGPFNAILYIVSQLIGSITGAALTRGTLSQAAFVNISGGATLLGTNSTVEEGLLAEIVLTAILILTVLLTAVDPSTKSSLAPLAIGFAVIVCILAGGPISGASLNPARSLGPAVAMTTYSSNVWENHWLYWAGPAVGAVFAAVVHRLILAGPEKRVLF